MIFTSVFFVCLSFGNTGREDDGEEAYSAPFEVNSLMLPAPFPGESVFCIHNIQVIQLISSS